MIALLGAFFVIFACIAFAMKKIGEQSKALENIRGLKQALIYISEKMNFEATPLPVLMSQISEDDFGDVAVFFTEVSKGLTDGEKRTLKQVWSENLNTYAKKLNLSHTTVRIMNNIGLRLGKMAQQAELEALRTAQDELELQISMAEKELSNNTRLLKSGGILVGILIVIIFI